MKRYSSYICWCETRGFPQIIHNTLDSARTEAERLAKKERMAVSVYGLVKIGTARHSEPPVVWEEA